MKEKLFAISKILAFAGRDNNWRCLRRCLDKVRIAIVGVAAAENYIGLLLWIRNARWLFTLCRMLPTSLPHDPIQTIFMHAPYGETIILQPWTCNICSTCLVKLRWWEEEKRWILHFIITFRHLRRSLSFADPHNHERHCCSHSHPPHHRPGTRSILNYHRGYLAAYYWRCRFQLACAQNSCNDVLENTWAVLRGIIECF